MRMCDIFLRRGIAVPRAPALNRLRTGPFSMIALFTRRLSAERLLLFSAFAMALFGVFAHLFRGHARVAREGLNFHGDEDDSDRGVGDSSPAEAGPYPFGYFGLI